MIIYLFEINHSYNYNYHSILLSTPPFETKILGPAAKDHNTGPLIFEGCRGEKTRYIGIYWISSCIVIVVIVIVIIACSPLSNHGILELQSTLCTAGGADEWITMMEKKFAYEPVHCNRLLFKYLPHHHEQLSDINASYLLGMFVTLLCIL